MVMGKVSKAIAASFLCLLFNSSGTTNAMKAAENTTVKKEISNNNINDINNSEEVFNVSMEQEKEGNGDNSDGKNNKKTNILQIIIPVAAGVGGFVLGAILGKFVF